MSKQKEEIRLIPFSFIWRDKVIVDLTRKYPQDSLKILKTQTDTMTKQNRLITAYFYKKEGAMIWIMYFIFFVLGYLYGKRGESILVISILFLIMLILILIFGKKETED